MKLAILGNSPLALEAALRFHLHGASLTWFVDQDYLSEFNSPHFAQDSFITQTGLSVLKEMDRDYFQEKFQWEVWKENYQTPLMNYLKSHQEVKIDEVISVTKRFLAPGEVIPGKSRFFDLFRVIYHVNPKEFIEQQKETNPETYKKLTEEFVNSLSSKVEMYQDYDMVLDLRNDLFKSSAAKSGRALGESRVTDKVQCGGAALKKAKELTAGPDMRELALVGSDSLAAEILIALESWLKEPRSRIFVISTEDDPFQNYLSVAHLDSKEKLQSIFSEIEKEFQNEVDAFTHKLREWQELDDFVQVKIPKPVEPIPRLNFFSGHNVSAMDELIDRKRMFLTLERPEFRHGQKHPENNYLDLKTIGVDQILIGHAKKNNSMIQLDPNEIGFFDITPGRPNMKDSWENDLMKLEGIEDEIFKLFSPVNSH